MLKFALYTSNHGYGHSTRITALASEFVRFGIQVCIRTNRPDFLFRQLDPHFGEVSESSIDFGVIHGPNLVTDIASTRSALLRLMNRRLELIDAEIDWLRSSGIDLVIADIPWLAVEAASYAGIPVFAISNFDWFYIYQAIFADDRDLKPVLNAIYGIYQRVNFAYRLPFSGQDGMQAFPGAIKLGLLARKKDTYNDVRTRHGIPAGEPVLFSMFGGEGQIDLDLETICKVFQGWVISTNTEISSDRHICIAADSDFLDYIKAADIILTKPGYSSLAEAVQFGKTIIYRERLHYPEERLLIQGLENYPYKYALSQKKLSQRDWTALFRKIASQKETRISRAYKNSNSEIAARMIADYTGLRAKRSQLLSVFDIGSNNLNYCLYDQTRDQIIHTTQVATGLARGVSHKRLKAAAIRRCKLGFSQIHTYDKRIQSKKHVLATGISRNAINADTISSWLQQKHGLRMRIIKPYDEIRYVHYAARQRDRSSAGVLSFDIGGASTEFAWQEAGRKIQGQSMELGLLMLIQNYPDQEARVAAIRIALEALNPESVSTVVGIGLTVVFLEQIIRQDFRFALRTGEWGRLQRFELENLLSNLLAGNHSNLLPYMREPVNLDILALSCQFCILIMDRFATSEIMVCPDGISAGFARSQKPGKNLNRKQV